MTQPKLGVIKLPKWSVQLSHFVNSVAISDDAARVVAGTYFHNYNRGSGHSPNGTFGTYCYDSGGNQLWKDEFQGYEGVYSVGISGDGKVAAAGGWFKNNKGLLRAYNAATGKNLLNYSAIPDRVSSLSLSSDGSVLAAASDQIYVFTTSGQSFSSSPATIAFGNTPVPTSVVALHSDGTWLAACDQGGNVCLATIQNGAIVNTYNWTPPQPVPFVSIAISRSGESFVVGGGDIVYLFTKNSMIQGNGPVAQYNTPNGGTKQDVRWVAISDDGTFVTAVQNDGLAQTGLLHALSYSNGNLIPAWQNPNALNYNPNSTSVDSAAKYITAADGYPENAPGTFYLFDASSGNKLWDASTDNMNWPMVISADGTGITAGSDNGFLYYFQP